MLLYLSALVLSIVVTLEHLWLVDDLNPARAPQAPLRRLDVNLPHAPGGGTNSQAQTPTENPRRSRLLSGKSLLLRQLHVVFRKYCKYVVQINCTPESLINT